MTLAVDEDEHSLEMHLPFIRHLLARNGLADRIRLVPVLVGSLNDRQHRRFGEIFAGYLRDPANRFVISSDFCHWGPRFQYFYQPPAANDSDQNDRKIHESIEALDKEGMRLIEQLDWRGFAQYLRETGNTICGRHPIQILLHAIDVLKEQEQKAGDGKNRDEDDGWRIAFVRYDQSSRARLPTDHSVSYAAAAVSR